MTGFASISDVLPKTDSGNLKSTQYSVAVKVWFTSAGQMQPLSFKFEGEDGTMQYVKTLTVESSEDKNYAGIPSREFRCSACIGGITQHFRLLFYPENSKWTMVIQ